uniref:Uncharacterized protein n=1 Tax=viral metagenome TaxID=1070528 RepID=A0A6C0EF93_9ZZZZ
MSFNNEEIEGIKIVTDLDTNETVKTTTKTVKEIKNTLSAESFVDIKKTPTKIIVDALKKFEDDTHVKYKEELDDTDSIFHNIKDSFRGMDLDVSNIMLYAARTMEMVEIFKSGDGLEKKHIVMNIIFKFIDDNLEISNDDKEFIRFMLESLIETILKTSKKEIDLASKDNKGKGSKNNKGKGVEKKGKMKSKANNNMNLSIGQIVESLIDKCVTIIRTNKYKADNVIINIPIMAGMVMSLVDNYNYLNGNEKKTVVVKVIQKLITHKIPKLVELDDSHKRKLNLVSQIIPNVIDVLIDVAKGRYEINEVLDNVCGLFSCCKGKKN